VSPENKAGIDRRRFLKGAAGAALAGASAGLAAVVPQRKQPNILILTVDQQSAAAMSCRIGSTFLHTPCMDALSAGGMNFSRVYAANPICSPSRTAVYSGRYPVETGFQVNPGEEGSTTNNHEPARMIDPQVFPCMGTHFKSAGYETAYFGKWHIPYPPKKTETHGFDTIQTETFDPRTADRMCAFLGQPHDKPFLAVASFMNPHNICEWARGQKLPDGPIGDPPPPEKCPPLRGDFALQKDEPAIMTLMRKSYQSTPVFPVGGFDEGKWRQYQWAYYRMIEMVDAQMNQILQALRANGLERDTLVIFFADHGDCQGAHHWNQKTVFYEESVQVPLILNWPGRIQQGSSDLLVNLGVDILPTVCAFAGIEKPTNLPGISLHEAALGEKSTEMREYVVSSNDLDQGGPIDGVTPRAQGRMVRSRRYKYCIYTCADERTKGASRESLVDFEKDPGEMVNVAASPAYREVLAQHRVMLRTWCARYKDSFPQFA